MLVAGLAFGQVAPSAGAAAQAGGEPRPAGGGPMFGGERLAVHFGMR